MAIVIWEKTNTFLESINTFKNLYLSIAYSSFSNFIIDCQMTFSNKMVFKCSWIYINCFVIKATLINYYFLKSSTVNFEIA